MSSKIKSTIRVSWVAKSRSRSDLADSVEKPMARIQISGLGIEYELFGPKDAPAIVLTPGGRFAKDSPGLPELARALAAGGRRVLLWDRPNCGASDISFEGKSESDLQVGTRIRADSRARARADGCGCRVGRFARVSHRRGARSRGSLAFDRVVDQRRGSQPDISRGLLLRWFRDRSEPRRYGRRGGFARLG